MPSSTSSSVGEKRPIDGAVSPVAGGNSIKRPKSRGDVCYDTVVVDIEGTTTPISFVKDVLFPFVTDNVDAFLEDKWEAAEMQDKVAELRDQASRDIENKYPGATAILPADHSDAKAIRESVATSIRWQVAADRKIGALKSFQGYMWRFAYEDGRVKGSVFDDVLPAFERWINDNVKLYVYSSGSVEAQKLLFGYSDKGDLLDRFSGHFDTKIGLKVESASYVKIAEEIHTDPTRVLFLSDNILEIKAAHAAGFKTAVVSRPGNAALIPEPVKSLSDTTVVVLVDGKGVPVIESFSEIFDREDEL